MSLYVNGKKTDVKELIKQYNIPIATVGKRKKYIDFELHPTQVKPDYLNGGLRHSVTRGYLTVFRAADPKTGEDIEIVYSKTPPRKDKNDRMQYSPRELVFNGHKQRFDLHQNLEQAVYTYLYPSTEDSPFFNKLKGAEWRLFNPEKIAERVVAQDEMLTEALTFVKNTGADQLKVIGKGIGLSFGEEVTDIEIRSILTGVAKTNPETFLLKVTSNSVQWRGRIKDAIDTGIFTIKTINGFPRWFWEQGDRAGKEICIIEGGANPFEFLVQWMIEHDFQDFYGELNRVQKKDAVAAELERQLEGVKEPAKEPTFREMVVELAAREQLFYNLENKTIYWVDGEVFDKIVKVRANANKGWIEVLQNEAEMDAKLMDKIKTLYKG